jgi:glycerate 2-kinase
MHERSRPTLLEIFQAALDAVNGRRCVAASLRSWQPPGPVFLIAFGKVACPMTLGAIDAIGAKIRDAFIVTKHGYAEPLPWPVLEAAHPVPDATSLAAGAGLHRFADAIPGEATVLVLLSGGASALVEELPPGADLDTLQRLNEWLLGSGRDIVAMNRVRKRLSAIKGGRLAQRLAPRPVLCLAISDVATDDPRFIGSGPLVADDTIARESIDDAPADIRAALTGAAAPPRSGDPCFARVRFEIVARLADAMKGAAAAARRRGMPAVIHSDMIAGDAAAAGEHLARALLADDPGVLHIWGGETTVRLPPTPGRGGRAQNLTLAAARLLAGHDDALLLAAGTDGTDGPTSDAGALVDGGTIERGVEAGLSADAALARADAGTFLEASGDLIRTGPTGTNVMDLMLGLRAEGGGTAANAKPQTSTEKHGR